VGAQWVTHAKLANAVSAALAAVLPRGFEVPVINDGLAFGDEQQRAAWSGAEIDEITPTGAETSPTVELPRATSGPTDPTRLEVDELRDYLLDLLHQVQADVAEETTEPWPAAAPSAMPEPFVEVGDDQLIAGYGHAADPALSLISTPLNRLR
jgi:hypothetical protein